MKLQEFLDQFPDNENMTDEQAELEVIIDTGFTILSVNGARFDYALKKVYIDADDN